MACRGLVWPARSRPLGGFFALVIWPNETVGIMPSMAEADDVLEIESLDLEGQGVARRPDGKVVFVEGALPGERVRVRVTRTKGQWERAETEAVVVESPQRVRPRCPHFGLQAGACGGCKLQHLEPSAQVAVKQRVLEDQLWHLGKVRTERLLPAVYGPMWGYRHRARLSVRFVEKKGAVLVGFHERKSRFVADMRSCAVLPPRLSELLPALRGLINRLEARSRVPQIELAVGEETTALVLRHLDPLVKEDLVKLAEFETRHPIRWWLQPAGPDSVRPLVPESDDGAGGFGLSYRLPEFGLRMPFKPTDFTQVNPQVNTVLVSRAVRLLEATADDRVIDWFCGLGNFTLPIAQRAGSVLGLEGSSALVKRAEDSAKRHGLLGRAQFRAQDLFQMDALALVALGTAQRWLVDPPREGAFALVKALTDTLENSADAKPSTEPGAAAWSPPARIVYVSCNPATLARDAGLLVHRAGYRLRLAGVVNMFPHTAHVESVGVFDRP